MGERQIYHEKWDQRRKVRWMQPHKMQDSSLNELRDELALFVAHPTERASMAQGLFMVGPGAGL